MLKTHRDLLAILLGVIIIPLIWILQGIGMLTLSGEVVGATIAIETLVAQFYFRKSQSSENAS